MSERGFNRPQNQRTFRRGLAIGLIFVCILMMLADRQQKQVLESGRLTPDDISAKIMGTFAAPVRGIEKLFSTMGDRARAYEENKILKAENERLLAFEHKVLDLETRIKIFEDLLGMEPGENEIKRVAARSVSEVNGPFVHSTLINAGTNKNIAQGHAVATVDGLLGHVVRVGKSSARVLLLNDLNSHISVMSRRSHSRAIMIGTNGKRPQLDYIAPEADWQVGDRVVTSGDGGVFPSGIAIGVVENLKGKNLGVKLNTQDTPVDWVWVYLFSPTEAPEESVEEELATEEANAGVSEQNP
ncbi:MAG: rod shape-determining protein MreC [Hyphomonadaceae bacterium]|nr:rod shape-determining protein MreC [Hyphomonadaceae bacterium]